MSALLYAVLVRVPRADSIPDPSDRLSRHLEVGAPTSGSKPRASHLDVFVISASITLDIAKVFDLPRGRHSRTG